MRLFIFLILMFLAGSARAQSSGTQPFTAFIKGAPTASTPLGSADFIPVIQNNVTKKVPATANAFNYTLGPITQTLQLAAGASGGITIAGDILAQEDLLHNLSIATSNTIASILIGAPNPLTAPLLAPGRAIFQGAVVMQGGLALTALQPGGGGRCLGWNPFTKQIYVSLASC